MLSAKWGVIDPDEVVAPYDVALSNTSTAYRAAWGEFVAQQLATKLPLRGLRIEIHAGDAYVNAVRGPLTRLGATVTDPVDATSMGGTLAWYDRAPAPTSLAGPAARLVEDQVAVALDALGLPARVQSPADLLAASPPALDQPGLYSWWIDEAGAAELTRGLGVPIQAGLLYAGLAGATRAGGRTSGNSLRGRLVAMHLEGTRRFSTFRLSLGVTLDAAHGVGGGDDDLSAWMRQRLGIAIWPSDDADTLGAVEGQVLATLDPPFNLQGMPSSPVRKRLSELRKQVPR